MKAKTLIIGGCTAALSSAPFVYGFTQKSNAQQWDEQLFWIYRKMPLKILSSITGSLMAVEIPVGWRQTVVGSFSKLIQADMAEVKDSNLANYATLNQFFTRELSPGARQFQKSSIPCQIWSPCDGKILQFGPIVSKILDSNKEVQIEVKGQKFSVSSFLGPMVMSDGDTRKDYCAEELVKDKKNNCLYACVIYLSPSDCHRFFSPISWSVHLARYIPGCLLSVRPSLLQKFAIKSPKTDHSKDLDTSRLLCHQERCVLLGQWGWGFFAFAAVGATGVGSMTFNHFPELVTNNRKQLEIPHGLTSRLPRDFYVSNGNGHRRIGLGDEIGQFNLGSTIVLFFEAPRNLKFSLARNEKCQIGQFLLH